MGNWINKTFRKSKCVKLILFREGQKQTTHYVVPRDSLVKIENMQFQIDAKNYYIDEKRFITYTYNARNIPSLQVALDPMLYSKDTKPFNPVSLDTLIDNEVARQIIKHAKKGMDDALIPILTIMLMFVGFFVLYYLLGNQITELKELITGGQV